MHQDEVKGNKETSEKAAALEKMQAEMLALDVTWAVSVERHGLGWLVGWIPSGKLTWLAGKPPFLIGDTSSHAGFSIAMLVYQRV